MPNCKWLVEIGSMEDVESIAKAAESRGLSVVRTKLFDSLVNVYGEFGDADCVVPYGSLNLVKSIMRKPWVPGAWYNVRAFLCSTYFSHLGKYLLNDQYSMMPIVEVIR